MADYTVIPKEFREEYASKFKDINPNDIPDLAEKDPVVFGYYYLGKTIRLHQAYVMHKILVSKTKRVAICWARQLGKSISLGIFLLWSCFYNTYPCGISNITMNYIVSKEDESAVELLEKVRLILYDGDKHMAKIQELDNFFTGSLKEPNNTHQLTFTNNCFIKSVPPTMKAVGKSASWLVIDEAHRLRCTETDPDTFFDYASAIVAETGGGIILSSSPEGIVGFFYRAIDPEKQFSENRYDSFWFSHEIWNDGTKECLRYQEYVEGEKVRQASAGRIKYWQQEYQALFTVTETSFFDIEDIQNGLKDTPIEYHWKKTPCCLGVDYGQKVSRTVLTIRTIIDNEIIQLFQYRCPAGFDTNYLTDPEWEHSFQNLKKRYNLILVVPDDCSQGNEANMWMEKNLGVQVKKYNFRSDQMSKDDGINRNCLAYSYRNRLKAKDGVKLKIPTWNDVQIFEMKVVQEITQKVLISIKSPVGQLCDTFDSDMMACLPFLDLQDSRDFVVGVPGELEEKEMVNKNSPRYDGFRMADEKYIEELIEQRSQGFFPEENEGR